MNPPGPRTDVESVAAFFDRYSAAVLRLCRRITSSVEDAEDARQEAFLQLQRHWGRLDPHQNPVGWLFRTAAHAALKIRQRRPVQVDNRGGPESAPPVLMAEDQEKIAAAVRSLPRDYRALIQERFHGGRSPADIARKLGVPPGRIRVQLCRALRILREIVRGMT